MCSVGFRSGLVAVDVCFGPLSNPGPMTFDGALWLYLEHCAPKYRDSLPISWCHAQIHGTQYQKEQSKPKTSVNVWLIHVIFGFYLDIISHYLRFTKSCNLVICPQDIISEGSWLVQVCFGKLEPGFPGCLSRVWISSRICYAAVCGPFPTIQIILRCKHWSTFLLCLFSWRSATVPWTLNFLINTGHGGHGNIKVSGDFQDLWTWDCPRFATVFRLESLSFLDAQCGTQVTQNSRMSTLLYLN